jgi:hypothetical protein
VLKRGIRRVKLVVEEGSATKNVQVKIAMGEGRARVGVAGT